MQWWILVLVMMPWRQYAQPEAAGYSAAALAAARDSMERAGSAAVFITHRGRVLAAWGDVARPLPAHSIRKSMMSVLYGVAELSLEPSLAELGVDDTTRLTSAEQQAKLRDLLAARSGVYLPAAYADASQDAERPARGSHAPGTHFFYNNWDFNVLESVYEQMTGESVYGSFARRLAVPLGMEDYDSTAGYDVYAPSRSRYPAHTQRISARDLARLGELVRRRGEWQGQRIVRASWVDSSTAVISALGDGAGYGYLWWRYPAGSLGANYPHANQQDIILARGSGGHALFIIPGAELVIVHRADTDRGRTVNGRAIWKLVESVLAARVGAAQTSPELVPMTAVPFANQPPPYVRPTWVRTDHTPVLGTYDLGNGVSARVFEWRDRLFVNVTGMGELELLALSATEYGAESEPTLRVRFMGDEVEARVGDTVLRGRKR